MAVKKDKSVEIEPAPESVIDQAGTVEPSTKTQEEIDAEHAESVAAFDANHEQAVAARESFIKAAMEHAEGLALVSQEAEFRIMSGNIGLADSARRTKIIADALLFLVRSIAASV